MRQLAPEVAAAELGVVQSRLEMQGSVRRLNRRLTSPSFLAVAAVAGAVFVFSLARRGSTGALAGALAIALLRRIYVR